MPVLLGRPATGPARPGIGAGRAVIADEAANDGMVRADGLLRHHVAHR